MDVGKILFLLEVMEGECHCYSCYFEVCFLEYKQDCKKHEFQFDLFALFLAGNTMTLRNCTLNSTSDETIVGNQTSATLGAFILTVTFLLGFPGNFFVIWSILARARKQSVTTLLILNLAIADGSLMVITPFFIVYLVMKNWMIGNVMCKILYYLSMANMYASIHLIMLMSIYRMISVIWPQRISVLTGKRTLMRVLGVVWGLVMIASIPALIFREVTCKKTSQGLACDPHHKKNRDVSKDD